MKKISRGSAFSKSTHLLLIVMSALIAVSVAFAQTPAPTASTRIVSRSQLVLVPVIVRDKSGHPAKGLTKQDFIVQENGKEKTVAIFDEVSTSNAPLSRPASTGEFTNVQPANTAPRRLVIMVFDRINTPMFDQNYARYQMAKYLSTAISDNALVALVTLDLGGIRVVRDFTDDRDALLTELAKLRSAPDFGDNVFAGAPDKFGSSGSIMEALMKDFEEQENKARANEKAARSHQSIRRTLDAMEKLARAYSGVPGRKALVWITAGFPFTVNSAGRLLGTLPMGVRDSLTELMPIYERTWQVLNDANMSIYTVDARGLVASPSQLYQAGTSGPARPTSFVEQWRLQELMFSDSMATMRSFAEMTGGKAYVNTNDLSSSFRDAADDSSHYYMLGYYLDGKDTTAGWRNLKVRMRKGGLEVRTRTGFFVNPKRDDSKHDLDLALTSPLQLTEIPLTVRWTEQKPLPNTREVQTGFTVTLLPEGIAVDETNGNRMGFEALAIAVTPDGKSLTDVAHKAETRLTAQQLETIRKQGATYNDFLKLQPGSYTVRFVIRDLVSGRVGSVIAPLTVAK